VHASDIQLLDGKAVSLIPDWQPTIALVGEPPLCKTRQEDKVNIVGKVAAKIRDFIYREYYVATEPY
jgi:predicted metallo-beta-lactamase superfamily hydrolase